MFASKVLALVLAVTACRAAPLWIENPTWRSVQPPSIAFGFGSGISSDIGGFRHSSGIGASFQSGRGRAFGAGFGSTGGNTYAQGVGIAEVEPAYAQPLPTYGNFGSAFGAGSSSAQSLSGVQYPVQAVRPHPFFAVSSAHNSRGLGYNTAVSAVEGAGAGGNYGGSAVSAAQNHNGVSDYGSTFSIAHNAGGVRASAAEALQRHGGRLQHVGATSINSPGVQVAQAHSINAGGYY